MIGFQRIVVGMKTSISFILMQNIATQVLQLVLLILHLQINLARPINRKVIYHKFGNYLFQRFDLGTALAVTNLEVSIM
jgi:hypothetical protein